MLKRPLGAVALALALAVTPACAQLGAPKLENPVSAAKTADQNAYAVLETYAAALEEATDILRDPEAPVGLKQALTKAERVATPLAQTLQLAVVGYLRARADYEAVSADATRLERAAAALAIAAARLEDAMRAARAPVLELATLAHRKSSV